MNLAEVRAQLEHELTWRWNEIRFLHNQLFHISDEANKDRYRKSLVVMLYAHYEGFCRTALSIYAGAVNEANVRCGDASPCIAAASLAGVFRDFENPQRRSELFSRSLPDDTALHRFARRVELLERLGDIWSRVVAIPAEAVVDAEGNLTPTVMRKLLYRLGFAHDAFQNYDGRIDLLLNRRNGIAHGARRDGITESEYRQVEEAAHDIMQELVKMIFSALKCTMYLKPSGESSS